MGDALTRYRMRSVYIAPPPPPPPPPPPGGDTLIGYVTIENAEATTKTNEIFETGLPTGPTHVATGQVLKIKDDDGSGGIGSTLALAQVDLVHTDGNSKQRFAKVTGIIPDLLSSSGGAMKRRRLAVYSSSDALPTGTAITIADVQALAGYANGLFDVRCDIAGTVYSVSVKDILDAGVTSFTKTALWTCSQTIRSGPLCVEWRLRAPLRNSGAAHNSGNGLHAEFHLVAYKAGSAAVSGGNPITAIRCDVEIQNADLTRDLADTQHYYYGLEIRRATSLADATMISTDQTCYPYGAQRFLYARSQPAATITLSSSAVGSRTFALSAGSWANDIVGAHIVDAGGAGKAVVATRTSSTVVTAYVYTAFSGTSYTSGNWTIEGIGHHYNTLVNRRAWIGNRPTHVTALGDHTSAVTPTTDGVAQFLADAEAILEPAIAVSDVSHTTGITSLDLMRGDAGTIRPLTFRGEENTAMGEIAPYYPATGPRPQIGPQPQYYVEGLVKYDTNGRRRIFENAEYVNTNNWLAPPRLSGSPTNGDLTLPPRADQGGTSYYKWHDGTVRTWDVNRPVGSAHFWPINSDATHHPAGPYVPWLLTGDYRWLSAQMRSESYYGWMYFGENVVSSPNYGNGTISTKGPMGGVDSYSEFGNVHTRGMAWTLREMLLMTASAPDASASSLWHPKSYYTGRLAQRSAGAAYWINTARLISPTTGPIWDFREGGSNNYPTEDPNLNIELLTPWTFGYLASIVSQVWYLGLEDADWEEYIDWMVRHFVESYTDPNVVWEPYSVTFQHVAKMNDGSNSITSVSTGDPVNMAEMYHRTCMTGPSNPNGWGLYRTPTGTLTISDATVGSSRTFTFSNSYFASGGTGSSAWYAGNGSAWLGGYIRSQRNGVLAFSSRTGAFTAGQTLTQAATGATATILSVITDDGSSGTLAIEKTNSTAFGAYTITDPLGGGAIAGEFVEGLAKITSVTFGTVVVATIINRFGSTTPGISYVQIPGAHPSDYAGEAESVAGRAETYNLACALKALQKPRPGATDDMITALEARTAYDPVGEAPHFHIVART